MKLLLKLASYLFHPLWMPLAGSFFYFLLIPRYFPEEVIKAKLLAISIITVFIPIVFYFLLKNLGKVGTIFLETAEERRWPLFFFMLLCGMVLHQILNPYSYPALFYYFVGILASTSCVLLMTFFKIKVSLHMVGITALMMFITGFCIYFHLNFIYTICFMIVATGLTASSRLFYKAHSNLELILGIIFGIIPQVIVLRFWL